MALEGSKEPGIGDQEVGKMDEGRLLDLGNKEMSGPRSEGWPDNGHCL